MMSELAWREIGNNVAVAIRILGGKSNLIFVDDRSFIVNRNVDTPGVDYCGSVYPTDVVRTLAAKSVDCIEGHYDPSRPWRTRYRLGQVRDIRWDEVQQALIGDWLPNRGGLHRLLEAEQNDTLLGISGYYLLDDFEPLMIGDKRWKLVKAARLSSVDVVSRPTGGGRVLRQSETKITTKRLRINGGHITQPH